MRGFKISLRLGELIGDNFTSIFYIEEACKKEDIQDKLELLSKNFKRFIEENDKE